MSRKSRSNTMLELWRPLAEAGVPVGCITTTYTFNPELFAEHCLARFLTIESEPKREDLAFRLEREARLGGIYAGVLVDHVWSGVEHSLRWDVLPIRIPSGKQHAKLSLLAWSNQVRLIVSSANLSQPGYRSNREVAAALDFTPSRSNTDVLRQALDFLKNLLSFSVSGVVVSPEVIRAESFLKQIDGMTSDWKEISLRKDPIRQYLVFTLPKRKAKADAQSTLEEAFKYCRARGGSPDEVRIASPFFDDDGNAARLTASLCKLMARGQMRKLCFCVPAIWEESNEEVLRLAAPKVLWEKPKEYNGTVLIAVLPKKDPDNNPRSWHAKLFALNSQDYSSLMVGSANFTCSGMGTTTNRNAEANLLTIVEKARYRREVGQLDEVWPTMGIIAHPESMEWLCSGPLAEEDEPNSLTPLPTGFLFATFHAKKPRKIVLHVDGEALPSSWKVSVNEKGWSVLATSEDWQANGRLTTIEFLWTQPFSPDKLKISWSSHEAFMTLNVMDMNSLPPPNELECMTADELLSILASTAPSSAFRAWAREKHPEDHFDDELDSATAPDLDPLRRYDIQETFLHVIRRRARILASLRVSLERPVWSVQALVWRFRGLMGVELLADRYAAELTDPDKPRDKALLMLADLLIVLNEIDYKPEKGALSKEDFQNVFRPFLRELSRKLDNVIDKIGVSCDLHDFWVRVMELCQK